MYIDQLDHIVSKYNNRHHSTIKIKSFDVKSSTRIDFDKENNKKDPKIGNYVRIPKHKS